MKEFLTQEAHLKPLVWMKSSKKDLKSFPVDVMKDIGFALYEAQKGKKSMDAKPLKGLALAPWKWSKTSIVILTGPSTP